MAAMGAGRDGGDGRDAAAQGPSFHAKPAGNLKQVMRSIPYPNSEIVYAVQTKAPASADEWKTVENASIAIAETANLTPVCRAG